MPRTRVSAIFVNLGGWSDGNCFGEHLKDVRRAGLICKWDLSQQLFNRWLKYALYPSHGSLECRNIKKRDLSSFKALQLPMKKTLTLKSKGVLTYWKFSCSHSARNLGCKTSQSSRWLNNDHILPLLLCKRLVWVRKRKNRN